MMRISEEMDAALDPNAENLGSPHLGLWIPRIRALENDLERIRQLLYTFFYTQDEEAYQRVELELIGEARAKIDG